MTERHEALLTPEERKRAGLSSRMLATIAAVFVVFAVAVVALLGGQHGAGFESRDLAGAAVPMFLCAAGAALFGWMAWCTGRDVRRGVKIVVRGIVSEVQHNAPGTGTPWRIRVGPIHASDCLFPDPALMTELRVGRRVELSYLPGSGRTLRVTLL